MFGFSINYGFAILAFLLNGCTCNIYEPVMLSGVLLAAVHLNENMCFSCQYAIQIGNCQTIFSARTKTTTNE